MENKTDPSRSFATLAGFGAILLWSTTVAVVRSLSEQVGTIAGMTAVYGVAGGLALVPLLVSGRHRREVFQLPLRYLLGNGALFVGYMLLFTLAIGMVGTRQQVLEVGLLNYLWPTLMLLGSVVLLHAKARWWLLPGTLLALTGVVLVMTSGTRVELSPAALASHYASNPVAYTFALLAALFWALYSILTRKWAAGAKRSGVGLFLPATALAMFVLGLFSDEPRHWTGHAMVEVLYLGVATGTAYILWDHAMRRGNALLVGAGSYLTPLLSTLVSCLYLGVAPESQLWVGCAVLITGSVLSWKAMKD